MRIQEILEAKCPPATQDIKLNTENRNSTIENYMYGPLNIDHPGDYWTKAAKLWDTTEESAKESLCGNCVAFDISPRMEKCMPGKVSDEHGKLGYCWMHHFKCHSARTCETWAKGGPITDNDISLDWGKRASMNEENVPTNPSKWSYWKGQAKKKFDVYPSAYANGWAAKMYKKAGGGWKTKKK